MELQEQQNTIVDPTEFDNVPVQKEDETKDKNNSLNKQDQSKKNQAEV